MKKLIATVTVTALAALGAASLFLQPSQSQILGPKELPTQGGTASLVCLGGVTPGVKAGVSASKTDARLSGQGLVLSTAAGGTWSDSSGKRRISVGALTDPTKSVLGVGDARGVATFDTNALHDAVVAGSSSHEAAAGDLRSLAVSPCMWATSDMYLVGGSGGVGSANRLVLSNPSPTAVAIDIQGYSARGPIRLGGASQVVLAPGGYQEIWLDGLIEAKKEVALHLSTKSGKFGAVIQTSALEGAKPAGVSFVSASSFGRNLVIPGLSVPAQGDSLLPDRGWSGTVRLLNPTDHPATVALSTISVSGRRPLQGAQDIEIVPGGVLDLTLDGLRPGDYALQVASNSPVSAAVGTSITTSGGTDTAWAAAVPEFSRSAAVASGTLHLVGEGRAEVTTYKKDGSVLATRSVNVKALATVDITDAAAVSVVASTPMRGAVAEKSDTGIEWVPLSASGSSATSLDVQLLN
ncbi:DUF5719 family protein [Arcanobacterium canis]|uniref:DUF5719 family protein n=1 Tax=Arcanobacterium canis TaxID=999183 RepID=A0ABY8FZ07_9ACTO|nr:DUF5719 family protein [Arcanobacterium canis]WFM83752.1 DUF5719 family protein [Arcanobacterium canis]